MFLKNAVRHNIVVAVGESQWNEKREFQANLLARCYQNERNIANKLAF